MHVVRHIKNPDDFRPGFIVFLRLSPKITSVAKKSRGIDPEPQQTHPDCCLNANRGFDNMSGGANGYPQFTSSNGIKNRLGFGPRDFLV